MNNFISNPSETKKIIKEHQFTFKKSLGQNFLIEPNVLNKIVEKADITENTAVIEIGPGIGALTQKLATKAGRVIAIEIDQRLLPILNKTLSAYPHAEVIHGDVLKLSLGQIIEEKLQGFADIKIVANLPYYITTPIIMKLLEEKLPINSITVMVQKEVGERINAQPGTKDYGSLTLAIQYYAESKILFTVPKTVFMPPPNVDSLILQLKIREKPAVKVENEELLFQIIRVGFSQRRKTLFNNLTHNLINKEKKEELNKILHSIDIDPKRRAETLTLEEFTKLSLAITPLIEE